MMKNINDKRAKRKKKKNKYKKKKKKKKKEEEEKQRWRCGKIDGKMKIYEKTHIKDYRVQLANHQMKGLRDDKEMMQVGE